MNRRTSVLFKWGGRALSRLALRSRQSLRSVPTLSGIRSWKRDMKRVVMQSLMALALAAPVAAQSASNRAADERAIRDMITASDRGEPGAISSLPDRIFWSGAYKFPTMSAAEQAVRIDDPDVQNRVPGSQRSKTTIRRIDVASAGDMAYEFSSVLFTFQIRQPDGSDKEQPIDTSMLRVWKKVDGKWLLAASASFPNDPPPRVRSAAR